MGNTVYAPDSSMKKDMDLIVAHRRMLRKNNFDECNIGGFSFKSVNDRDELSCRSPGDTWKVFSEARPKKRVSDSMEGADKLLNTESRRPQIKISVEDLARNEDDK